MGAGLHQQIPLVDLAPQREKIGARLDAAISRVLAHGQYINGEEVRRLETSLAARTGSRHVITCSSGTDALVLVLLGWGIGPGDAVIVPAFTFAASAEAVARVGAVPVFADVDQNTFNIAPESLPGALTAARRAGLRPRALMTVDLFGQAADYGRIAPFARAEGMLLLADAAQSFGATLNAKPVGSLADATAVSFFPSKPLGCYGDGGAVFTDDEDLARTLRSLRSHGAGADKYDNLLIGLNARLDTLQAAILLAKLEIFDAEIAARQEVAERYASALRRLVTVPTLLSGATSVWASYSVRCGNRDRLAEALRRQGIATAVYYPKPLNHQTAYKHFPIAAGGVPVAEALCKQILSLPMHPYLSAETQSAIVQAVAISVQ